MAPDPLFDQLLLVALGFIGLILHLGWPEPRRPAPQTTANPDPPRRKRSKEPKPFAGYIHKPIGEACEQGLDTRPKAPGSPPPMLIFTRGRRRTVDTSGHVCPDHDCSYHGWLGRGNIGSNGQPGGQPWHQFPCVACQGYCSETHGTLLHGKRSSVELIVRVIACVAAGLGLRGMARVCEIDPHTVLGWWVEAAEQLKAFSTYCLPDLPLKQVQLDELYAVLSAVRDGARSAAEAIERLSRSPHWVWTASDPESKVLRSVQVGARTLALAPAVWHHLSQLRAPGGVPLLLRDGYAPSLPAIVPHGGRWVPPPRRPARGPAPTPRWLPRPGRLSAQVVKQMRRRRLVAVQHRVVFGVPGVINGKFSVRETAPKSLLGARHDYILNNSTLCYM